MVLFGGGDTGLLGDSWQLGSVVHGSVSRHGVACSGTAGLPLATSQDPYLGNLAVGGRCTLCLASPILTLVSTTNGFGFATMPLPVPALHALYGLALCTQACVVDPQGAASGLVVSVGRSLRIGV